MAYPIKDFEQIRNRIIQEIRGLTGITAPDDSEAAIRADGEASVVEGLYHHQSYIQKQLFVATADEEYLYIHAIRLQTPRKSGSKATGRVQAISNVAVTIPVGSKITDGKGRYWITLYKEQLSANKPREIQVVADQVGTNWNFDGQQLLWVSPLAGVAPLVDVLEMSGGVDVEDVEDWRQRLQDVEALGLIRDREADIVRVIKDVAGVAQVYPFPKRRGLGSFDFAITAAGNPPNSPSTALLQSVQVAIEAYSGFWADVRAYAPTKEYINLSVLVTGTVGLDVIEQVVRDYVGQLAPAETFLITTLISRIKDTAGVTDLQITPNANQTPTNSNFVTGWLRIGNLTVNYV